MRVGPLETRRGERPAIMQFACKPLWHYPDGIALSAKIAPAARGVFESTDKEGGMKHETA